MKQTIVIADGQSITAKGLNCILNENKAWQVTASLVNKNNLFEYLKVNKVDLLIIDPTMLLGFKNNDFGLLKKHYPLMEIMLIVNENHLLFVKEFLNQPITSFITKSCGTIEVIRAVESSLQKQKFYCHKVLEEFLGGKKDMDLPENCEPSILSDRELEIVKLVSVGKTTAQIAQMLSLSIHTINTHRKNILKKLELKSPAEMVRFGLANNLA